MTTNAPAAASAENAPAVTPQRSALRTICIGIMAISAAIAAGLIIHAVQGPGEYRTPQWAIIVHLATVIPAIPLGGWILWRKRRGDRAHRIGGYIWITLMMVTAIDSFWIRSMLGMIGPIHIFSVITLYSLPVAINHARHGRIAQHEKTMKGVYLGMIAAGLFTILPGRVLGNLIFG